jgi:hypothetical protein
MQLIPGLQVQLDLLVQRVLQALLEFKVRSALLVQQEPPVLRGLPGLQELLVQSVLQEVQDQALIK